MSHPSSAVPRVDEQSATNPRNPSLPARSGFFGRALIIPLIMLLLGVGAGVGGAVYTGGISLNGSSEAAETEEPAASAAAGHAPATVGIGGTESAVTVVAGSGNAVTNIGAFTVNLRGGAGGRVLRLEVQIETPSGQAADLTTHSAQLRDSIITAVSDYTWAELEGAEGKTRLRDELVTRVNGVIAPASIGRLYFTQFVIQ